MKWVWMKFDQLSAHELYEIMTLRQRVFTVEQNCAYLDADGFDLNAWHLCGWENSKVKPFLCAYLRVLPANVKYPEPSIGRVVTAPEERGKGFGRAIMMEALNRIRDEFGNTQVRISAQAYLKKFYMECGFTKVRGPYNEDGIPHHEMVLSSL